MSLPILLVAPPLVSLFFFSAFVVAGVNVTANCIDLNFFWTFNSLHQSPCTVAAYMLATCNEGSYTLAPMPTGYGYTGPTPESSNKCQCSTVGYSLISACVACQGSDTFSWSSYTVNCTPASTLPPSQFPNPVPDGITVPHWAVLDVTNEDNWDSYKSCAVADAPEFGPGAIFGPGGVYTSSPCQSSTSAYPASVSSASVSSTSVSSTSVSSVSLSSTNVSPSNVSSIAPPPHSHSVSHAGAIGGVLGSTTIVSIAVAAILYVRLRRTQTASAGVGASQPILNDGAVAQPLPRPQRTMVLYDPDDSTTFPGYQGGPRSLDTRPASLATFPPPRVESRSTLTDMQTSQMRTAGYRGFPMPSA